MDTHTWIKRRQPDFLKSLFTIIQVFLHIITYTVYTISPTFTSFLSPSRQNYQRWWHNHKLIPSWLQRPTHIDVFQMLLQFGIGMKTRQRQVGASGEWRKTKKSRCSISAAAIALLYGRSFRSPAFRSPSASKCRSEVMTFRSVVRHSCSGRPVPAFHHEHVQPNVEQESCLHIPVDKQLSFADDRRSEARFLLSDTIILHTVLSAPTHSRYTPHNSRDFKWQKFNMWPCLAEKS